MDRNHARSVGSAFWLAVFGLATSACSSVSFGSMMFDARVDAPRFDASSDSANVRDSGTDVQIVDVAVEEVQEYCAVGVCDPRAQIGCGSALHCVATGNGAVCAASVGMGVDGQSCASAFDCARGFLCAAEGRQGVCREVCCADGECGDGRACTGRGVVFASDRASGYRTCESPRSCSPFVSSDCPDTTSCYLLNTAGDFQCMVTGMRATGEICGGANDCLPQNVCVGIGTRRCARLCRIDGSTLCNGNERCQSQAYLPMNVGVCVSL